VRDMVVLVNASVGGRWMEKWTEVGRKQIRGNAVSKWLRFSWLSQNVSSSPSEIDKAFEIIQHRTRSMISTTRLGALSSILSVTAQQEAPRDH